MPCACKDAPALGSVACSHCCTSGFAQVQEQVPLAAAEVYLFTWKGHLCFLPGLPWFRMGSWRLPEVCLFRPSHLLGPLVQNCMRSCQQEHGYFMQQPMQHSCRAHIPLL